MNGHEEYKSIDVHKSAHAERGSDLHLHENSCDPLNDKFYTDDMIKQVEDIIQSAEKSKHTETIEAMHTQDETIQNSIILIYIYIDETLEEINPRCVLELLALPLDDEFQTKMEEGLRGIRNILWVVGGGGAGGVGGGYTNSNYCHRAMI
ncbi:Uncharacterized protein Fot_36331 [Forsythia ovata]|uniref:Plastid division protein CDP1-like 1st alpha solenoid domain-containing protein n=1 Tax=Forsythia ovata TaxID=205694 RepID=A0ABD1SQ57_9LAMI